MGDCSTITTLLLYAIVGLAVAVAVLSVSLYWSRRKINQLKRRSNLLEEAYMGLARRS